MRPLLALLLALLLVPRVAPAAWAQSEKQTERTIRVALLAREAPREVTVRGHGGGLELYLGDEQVRLTRVDVGEPVVLRREGREVRLDLPDGTLYALSAHFVPEAAFAVTAEGSEKAWPYAGALTVAPHEHRPALGLVNHVALEDYVASVIGGEYGLPDVEGTKAMAVAIRTYALRSGGKFGDEVDHVDNVLSQHYRGLRYVDDTTRAAARDTRGEVLTHDGELIEAVYFSSSGGRTADNEDVWEGQRLPYLRGKDDPFDAISPHRSWRSTVSRSRLLAVLAREAGRPVRGFLLGDASADGRIKSIELLHTGQRSAMQANRFRLLVNQAFGVHTLKSTLFTASRSGDRYVFEGRGYGHGVGLSQWGAHGMARQGHDYRDILAYYYTGIAIQQLDGTQTEPLAAPSVASSPSNSPPPPADPLSYVTADTSLAQPADTTFAGEVPAPPVKPKSKQTRRIGW